MQIHVVQPNQSLFGIAQAYNTTVTDIVEANDIPNPNRLVGGQALVIPIIGSFYWVQAGIVYGQLGENSRLTISN